MAGLPEKILEYLLETRVDNFGRADNALDDPLEDFILTHLLFLPSNHLCNHLKNYCYRAKRRLHEGSRSKWVRRS